MLLLWVDGHSARGLETETFEDRRKTDSEGDEKMKVCVPTSGQGGYDDMVSEHFGRSPTFTVVDTESEKVDVISNMSEHMGGSGKPPEQIAQTGAKVLLCSGLGPRAIDMLESSGIEVYVGAHGNVKNAIDMWRSGKLEKASRQNACRDHQH